MPAIGIYVLAVVALGVGFLLGRWEWRRRSSSVDGDRSDVAASLTASLTASLNFLVEGRPDLAAERLASGRPLDDGSASAYVALGVLVRRQGDVDKAVTIHRRVLSHPGLSAPHRAEAALELARDYLAADWPDRAAELLLEVAEGRGEERAAALELLMEARERQGDWQGAIDAGHQLLAWRGDDAVRVALTHYECELAEAALAAGAYDRAEARLDQAERHRPRSARTYLLRARLAFLGGHFKSALRNLERARKCDSSVAGETLNLYRDAARALGAEDRWNAYAASRQREADAAGSIPEQRFRCVACAVTTPTLVWQCPACRRWGSVQRM